MRPSPGSLTSFNLVVRLVDNGTMFQTPQIKHTHTAVSTAADKNVDTVGTESDIIHLLVVGNELCFSGQGGNIPDGAGCINAGGDDETW